MVTRCSSREGHKSSLVALASNVAPHQHQHQQCPNSINECKGGGSNQLRPGPIEQSPSQSIHLLDRRRRCSNSKDILQQGIIYLQLLIPEDEPFLIIYPFSHSEHFHYFRLHNVICAQLTESQGNERHQQQQQLKRHTQCFLSLPRYVYFQLLPSTHTALPYLPLDPPPYTSQPARQPASNILILPIPFLERRLRPAPTRIQLSQELRRDGRHILPLSLSIHAAEARPITYEHVRAGW